ncbi:MAG TPA: DNA starvation/stationary phase protection protein [Ktedonobacterales bacterium]|jgi:starvation-inducible DNA-binding protein
MTTTTKSGNRAMTGFPAPKRLATPTDLKPNEVQAVVEAVNPLVADSFALYIKTKNFHWHLSGQHFRDYHLLFDEQAAAILASIDVMAERVRRIGGTTIRSLGHIQRLTQVQDDNEDAVSPQDMLRRLLEDNSHMARSLRQAIATCEDNRDTVTANNLQEILDQTERRVWFLYETLQSA